MAKRILLKLSGEALATKSQRFLSEEKVSFLAEEIRTVQKRGVSIGLVMGGGNLFRGGRQEGLSLDRATADQIGMLATLMNGLALQELFCRHHLSTKLFSAVPCAFAPTYHIKEARAALDEGTLCLFSGGTTLPFFSTDTAAVIRALEINADLLLKATNVDGVYDADPKKHPDAKRYATLSFDEVLEKKLGVMDLAASALCQEHALPVVVFDIFTPGHLQRVIFHADIGTMIQPKETAL